MIGGTQCTLLESRGGELAGHWAKRGPKRPPRFFRPSALKKGGERSRSLCARLMRRCPDCPIELEQATLSEGQCLGAGDNEVVQRFDINKRKGLLEGLG